MSPGNLLHEPRLRVGVRPVIFLPDITRQLLAMLNSGSTLEATYARIIYNLSQTIGNGRKVDNRFYRTYIDVDVDEALRDYGFIHLHFIPKSTRDGRLLLLKQYEDAVVFCKVTGHEIFAPPPGKALQEALEADIQAALSTKTTVSK
ncbi:hypothetical protein [Asticcacaulis sp. W401b]|uniref:hypothetical protein n=1 Tax=Asticcacaulis sp. W401b TaxID=3388666 RepID=UPI0039711559